MLSRARWEYVKTGSGESGGEGEGGRACPAHYLQGDGALELGRPTGKGKGVVGKGFGHAALCVVELCRLCRQLLRERSI